MFCLGCGCDLRGAENNECTQCRRGFNRSDPNTFRRLSARQTLITRFGALFALGCLVGAVTSPLFITPSLRKWSSEIFSTSAWAIVGIIVAEGVLCGLFAVIIQACLNHWRR